MLVHHCDRGHHHRPVTGPKRAATSTVRHRHLRLRNIHSQTSVVVSADHLHASTLHGGLHVTFSRLSSRRLVSIRIFSFNFGRNVPIRTSVVVSIHFLPGPFCSPRVHAVANLSGGISSFILSRPGARRF